MRATLTVGGGLGLLAVLLLVPATGTALGELEQARDDRAEAVAAAAKPHGASPALVAGGLRVIAAGERGAADAVAARVRTLAARNGVLVEQAQPLKGGAGIGRVRLRLSGSSAAVVAMVDRLERASPLVRLVSWEAVALDGGGVRIEGEAVGAWR